MTAFFAAIIWKKHERARSTIASILGYYNTETKALEALDKARFAMRIKPDLNDYWFMTMPCWKD